MTLTIEQALLQAVEAHKSGKLQDAERLYRAILDVQPTHPDANHNLGVLAVGVGKAEEALPHLKAALEAHPQQGQFWISYINGLIEAQQLSEANQTLEKGKQLGLAGEAVAQLEQKLQEKRQAKSAAPSSQELHELLASYNAGDWALAEKLAKALTQTFPDHAFAWKVLGAVYKLTGRLQDSLEPMRQAVRLNPHDAEAHSNLGYTLNDLARFAEAEASCREAIRLDPDFTEAHSNLGNALKELDRLAEAEVCYREAIRLNPAFAEAHSNLGVTLQGLGRFAEAEASYREAIRLKPDYAEAHWNLSIILLLQSKLKDGFQLYEWRWDGGKESKGHQRHFPQPLWSGEEALGGKTMLIHTEQGLGDTIQFCRYVKMVHALGARVIFEVRPPLMALLAQLDGVDLLIAKGQPLPNFDYHSPLLSLPLAFKTDLATVPACIPYLHAQPERVQRWRERLGDTGFKIGICWKGTNKHRSIPIAAFYGLSQMPQVRLISLHKGEGEKELATLPAGMKVETLGAEFDSDGAFLDTAAVMTCCDLVITNDTSVAHVAGALGVRTWIALLFVPDWRWMLDRTDTPWYPTLRLFRQSAIGDWKSVFDQMQSTLRSELELLR